MKPVFNVAVENKLFERSGELITFSLSFLDLLLSHSAHALTKTVNMFKTAAAEHLRSASGGHARPTARPTRHRLRQQAESRKEESEKVIPEEEEEEYLELKDAPPGFRKLAFSKLLLVCHIRIYDFLYFGDA